MISTSGAGCLLMRGIYLSLSVGGHVGGHFIYESCAGCASWLMSEILRSFSSVPKHVVLRLKRR